MNMAYSTDAKEIPLTLVGAAGDVSTCPYLGWYRFKKCGIKTCKNFSARTQSGCLALDRESPTGNKIISDAELHLFKFSEDNVSTRLVSLKRKKAINRVKCILALRGFIEHLQTEYGDSSATRRAFSDPMLQEAEGSYPLKVKRVGFENWMWPFLVSKREYKLFAQRGRGEASTFTIQDLLDVSLSKLEGLRKAVP